MRVAMGGFEYINEFGGLRLEQREYIQNLPNESQQYHTQNQAVDHKRHQANLGNPSQEKGNGEISK